jgi:phosphoesterase RecJ-like protein
VNVARVAEKFGGGGHKNAAGCRVEGDWDEREREIVAALIKAVESQDYVEVEQELELSLA